VTTSRQAALRALIPGTEWPGAASNQAQTRGSCEAESLQEIIRKGEA